MIRTPSDPSPFFRFTCTQSRSLWPSCNECSLKMPSRRGFNCPLCSDDVSFNYEIQLYVHVRDIHQKLIPPVLVCELCGKSFVDPELLMDHLFMNEHSCNSEHLPCPNCDHPKLFGSQEDLDKHVKLFHSNPIIPAQGPMQTNYMHGVSPYLPQHPYYTSPRPPLVSPGLGWGITPGLPMQQTQPIVSSGYLGQYAPRLPVVRNPPLPVQGVHRAINAQAVNTSLESVLKTLNAIRPPIAPAVSTLSKPPLKTIPPLKPTVASQVDVKISMKETCQCFLCDTSFIRSTLGNLPACPECKRHFVSPVDVAKHILNFHKSELPFNLVHIGASCTVSGCLYQDQVFKLPELVVHHQRIHAGYFRDKCVFHLACKTCSQPFSSAGSLRGHSNAGINCGEPLTDDMFDRLVCAKCNVQCQSTAFTKCSFCGCLPSNEAEALYHIQEKHTGTVIKFKKWATLPKGSTKCPVHYLCPNKNCRLVLSDEGEMKEHAKDCQVLPTGSSSVAPKRVAASVRGSNSLVAFDCKLCGYSKTLFTGELSLCNQCPKKFPTSNDLQIHLLLDHNSVSAPFMKCELDECVGGKKSSEFTTIRSLLSHREESHKPERCLLHYACNCEDKFCGKLYGNFWMFHSAKHIAASDLPKEKRIRACGDCQLSVDFDDYLQCLKCDVIAVGDIEFMTHLKEKHYSENNLKIAGIDLKIRCQLPECNDIDLHLPIMEYLIHRYSKHGICLEHVVCRTTKDCLEIFPDAVLASEHKKVCGVVNDEPIVASTSRIIVPIEGPGIKRAKTQVEYRDSTEAEDKDAGTKKEATDSDSGSKRNWDDMMSDIMNYTDTLM